MANVNTRLHLPALTPRGSRTPRQGAPTNTRTQGRTEKLHGHPPWRHTRGDTARDEARHQHAEAKLPPADPKPRHGAPPHRISDLRHNRFHPPRIRACFPASWESLWRPGPRRWVSRAGVRPGPEPTGARATLRGELSTDPRAAPGWAGAAPIHPGARDAGARAAEAATPTGAAKRAPPPAPPSPPPRSPASSRRSGNSWGRRCPRTARRARGRARCRRGPESVGPGGCRSGSSPPPPPRQPGPATPERSARRPLDALAAAALGSASGQRVPRAGRSRPPPERTPLAVRPRLKVPPAKKSPRRTEPPSSSSRSHRPWSRPEEDPFVSPPKAAPPPGTPAGSPLLDPTVPGLVASRGGCTSPPPRGGRSPSVCAPASLRALGIPGAAWPLSGGRS